jgi:TP901 family phage tail tape measure protein
MNENDIGLSLDTRSVEKGVDKTVSALDTLITALEKLEKTSANSARASGTEINQALSRIRALSKDLEEVYIQVANAQESGTRRGPQLIAEQNKAIQSLYEARLASQVALGSAELEFWKQHGVALGGIQKKQLADAIANQKAGEAEIRMRSASATPMNLDETRLLLGLPSRDSMKSFAAQLKAQMSSDIAQEKLRAASATPMNLDETRLLLGLPSRDSMKSFAAQLKAQMSADMSQVKLRAASATPMSLDETRLLLGLPSRESMKSFAAQLKGEMLEMQKAQAAATKAQIPLDTVSGAFTPYDAMKRQAADLKRAQADLTKSNGELGGSFRQLAIDGNDVHSMARGLASSFGLLWLTWGNLIPLFAGAAISSSVKNVVTLGAEVQHTMETIRVLSGESSKSVGELNTQLLDLARTGPFGPKEIADAMKILSLAGLDASQVSASIKDVLNFAVAGTTDFKTAADVMTSVATAFNITAEGYNYVGDVISKTAAVSKSSVESIGEAFKTSSVLFKQYGVALEDVGLGLAALSNLGIQGSAAGTALRNMYVDLSGRTPKVAEALKALNIDLKDQNGRFIDLISLTKAYGEGLKNLKGDSLAKAISTISSERGGKPLIELWSLAEKRAKEFGSSAESELDNLSSKIKNSAGFMAVSAAQLALTPLNQLKSVSASLQATLVETFSGMEPAVLAFSRDLKAIFASEEFKAGLSTLATTALDFGRALVTVTATVVEHSKAFIALTLAYAGVRLASTLYVAQKTREAAVTAASTVATVADTAATVANTAAKTGGLLAVARFLPGVGTAVTVAGVAWSVYEAYSSSALRNQKGYIDSGYGQTLIANLQEEAKRLNEVADAKILNMSVDELRARKAKESSALETTAARVAAEQSVNDLTQKYEAATLKAIEDGRPKQIRDAEIAAEKLKNAKQTLETALETERIQKREIERSIQLTREAAERVKLANKPSLPPVTGTGAFAVDPEKGGGGSRKSPLFEIIKREGEQAAALAETRIATDEFDKINIELAKNLKGLNDTYEEATKKSKELTPARRAEIDADKLKAEALIKANAATQVQQALAKKEYEYTIQRIEAAYKEIQATDALTNSRFKAAKESERQIALRDSKYAFEQSLKYQLPAVQSAEKASYDVSASYIEKLKALREESFKRMGEMYSEDGTLLPGADIEGEYKRLAASQRELLALGSKETGIASAKAYQEAWDQTIGQISSDFTSQMLNGTLKVKDFMIDTFAKTVLQPQLNILMQKGFDWLLGGAGGWFSSLMGIPSFAGGGDTGVGPRSGGLDGQGGYLAMLHPKETVTDHTVAGSGTSAPVYVTINNTVGDVATKSMLDQYNAATVKQIQAGIGRSMRYNGAMSRG